MDKIPISKDSFASIPVIDHNLKTIQLTLDRINTSLYDGIFGTCELKCATDESEAMPTASLASIIKRVDDINSCLAKCEEYVERICPRNEDCCDAKIASH